MIINPSRLQCSIYLILNIAYSILSLVYPGTTVSKVCFLLLMFFSGYYMIKCIRLLRNSPSYIKWLLGLLILFSIYWLIYYISPNSYTITEGVSFLVVPKIEYLKNIYRSMLPIFVFYYFGSKGLISESWIRGASLILLAHAIFMYTYSYQFFVFNDEFGRTEMTNNHGYLFVSLFPLICFWRKRPIVQLIYMSIALIYIVMSMKRGAILTGIICSLFFLITILRNAKQKERVGILVGLGILFYVGMPKLFHFIANSERFQDRIMQTMEGDSSNRDMLYSNAIEHIFNDTTIFEFLFGTGADSSVGVLTNFAHNDWLEIGINQGLVGVLLYVFYFISFFQLWRKGRKINGYLNSALGLCFIICFIATFFSMSYNNMGISTSLSIGFMLSVTRNYNANKNQTISLK